MKPSASSLAAIAGRRICGAGPSVAGDFFWMETRRQGQQKKPGIDNLAAAIGLDVQAPRLGADRRGRDEVRRKRIPNHKGVMCAPASPSSTPKPSNNSSSAPEPTPATGGLEKPGVEVTMPRIAGAPVIDRLACTSCAYCPTAAPGATSPRNSLRILTRQAKSDLSLSMRFRRSLTNSSAIATMRGLGKSPGTGAGSSLRIWRFVLAGRGGVDTTEPRLRAHALKLPGLRSPRGNWKSWPGEVPAIYVCINRSKEDVDAGDKRGMTPRR